MIIYLEEVDVDQFELNVGDMTYQCDYDDMETLFYDLDRMWMSGVECPLRAEERRSGWDIVSRREDGRSNRQCISDNDAIAIVNAWFEFREAGEDEAGEDPVCSECQLAVPWRTEGF
jgi:hypothetical protein